MDHHLTRRHFKLGDIVDYHPDPEGPAVSKNHRVRSMIIHHDKIKAVFVSGIEESVKPEQLAYTEDPPSSMIMNHMQAIEHVLTWLDQLYETGYDGEDRDNEAEKRLADIVDIIKDRPTCPHCNDFLTKLGSGYRCDRCNAGWTYDPTKDTVAPRPRVNPFCSRKK